MNRKWMDIMEASGDESIGSMLVRLARQAADEHMNELTASLRELDRGEARRSAPAEEVRS